MPSNILKTSQTSKNADGAKRFSWFTIIITIVFLAVICVMIPIFRKKFLIENPDLFIKHINVTETTNYTGPANELDSASQSKIGKKISVYTILSEIGVEIDNNNIIELDIRKIRERLEEEAILKQIEVRKILPDTLDIRFAERIPQARIYAGSNTCYIDKDGIVLPPRHPNGTILKYENATVVTNISGIQNPDELQAGKKVNDKYLLAALSLIDKIQTHPDNFFKIKQVQIYKEGEMLILEAISFPSTEIFMPECKFTFPIFDMDKAIVELFHLAAQVKKDPKFKSTTIRNVDLTIPQKPSITP